MLTALLLLAAAGCTSEAESGGGESTEGDTTVEEAQTTDDTEPDEDDSAADAEAEEPEELAEPEEPADESPHGGAYGVSAGDPAAVDVGIEILEDGGTAVDAAVAVAFAMSVVEPFASGLGGGGAAVVYHPDEDPAAHDYRDPVPQTGQVPTGGTGIPGLVAGLEELHATYGSGSFTRLVDPATHLASDGVETSESLAFWLRSGGIPVGQLPHLYPGGAPLAEGDEVVQEDLADTLRRIATGGREAFYEGALGADLAERVAAIDTESLAAYEVAHHEPPVGEFAGHQVISSAPPLAGATLIQYLQIAEAMGVEDHEPGSADFIHTVATAWRISEQHLNWEIADPAFVDVPIDELTDQGMNAALAEQADMSSVVGIDPAQPHGGVERPDGNTTHITVIDSEGMMVSMTNTLSNFWGSGEYALGFFLNDQLTNFDARTGSPNPPPEAGKRIVGSSAPAIVLDAEGRPVLGLGSPGGPRIPNILAQVLIRWAMHDHDLAAAVEAPRQHGVGARLMFEDMPSNDVRSDLANRGHPGFEVPSFRYYFGSVQALEVDYDAQEVFGAADPRREGAWRVDTPAQVSDAAD